MSTPPEIPESMYNCNSDAPEGVAAPLEPSIKYSSPAEKFAHEWVWSHDTDNVYLLAEMLEAYAAAVSKNLQEELAKAEDMIGHYLKAGYLPHMSAEEARDWLKEIAALREKP